MSETEMTDEEFKEWSDRSIKRSIEALKAAAERHEREVAAFEARAKAAGRTQAEQFTIEWNALSERARANSRDPWAQAKVERAEREAAAAAKAGTGLIKTTVEAFKAWAKANAQPVVGNLNNPKPAQRKLTKEELSAEANRRAQALCDALNNPRPGRPR